MNNLTDSPVGTAAFWVNIEANNGFDFNYIVDSTTLRTYISSGDVFVDFPIITSPPGTATANYRSIGGTITIGSGFHHVLTSWDVSGASFVGSIYVDDALDFLLTNYTLDGTIPWYSLEVMTIMGHKQFPGGGIFSNTLRGCLAQLYINPGVYMDFSIVSNRRKFITAGLNVVDLGANGELPTGTSPRFYMTGGITGSTTFLPNSGTFDRPFVASSQLFNCPTEAP